MIEADARQILSAGSGTPPSRPHIPNGNAMVTLKSVNAGLRKASEAKLYPLKEALELAGITAPTYYRWLKSGKIEDSRVRGRRGVTLLPTDAIARLRDEATRVEVV